MLQKTQTFQEYTPGIPDHVLELVRQSMESHPYHHSCGVQIVEQAPGFARIQFALNDYTLNSAGFLHGGVLYGLMDVCGFGAAISLLQPDEQIVTHDIHCSVLSPVSKGYSCWIEAEVERKGSTIIFIRATAFAKQDGGEPKKIALATVTKSIVQNRIRR